VIPLPPLDSLSVFHLNAPAPYLNWPSWFYIQLPNVVWFGVALVIFLACLFVPFPSKAVDSSGYDVSGEG